MERITSTHQRRWVSWLATILVLAFFLSRLIAIDLFPPFLDEMQHVHEAELSAQSSPFAFTGEGRIFTLWWYMLYQPYRAAPVWLPRVATLLAVLPGLAAVIAIGQLAAGRWGAAFAGLAYLFSTSNFFFERLALADPISGSAVLVALWLAYRLSRRASTPDAVLCGVALFVAVGAKATALPYLGIPLAAALTLHPQGRSWRENARWGVIALITGVGLIVLFTLGLRLRGYTPFGFIELYNSQATTPILTRTMQNVADFAAWFSSYTGILMFGLLLIALVGLMLRRQFFFALCLFGPALVFWINERQYTRYFVALTVIFLLGGAVFLAQLIKRQHPAVKLIVLIGILIWGSLQWLPFAWDSYTAPERLWLPRRDYLEYIASDASGFGLPEAKEALIALHPTEVIGIFSNCRALRYLALQDFTVTCPTLNPSGQEIENLAALLANSREVGKYVVYEPLPYVPSRDRIPGQLIATFLRPNVDSPPTAVLLYALAP